MYIWSLVVAEAIIQLSLLIATAVHSVTNSLRLCSHQEKQNSIEPPTVSLCHSTRILPDGNVTKSYNRDVNQRNITSNRSAPKATFAMDYKVRIML